MKKHIKHILIALAIVLFYSILIGYFDITALFSFEMVQKKQELLLRLVREHYVWSVAGFIGVYIVHGTFALPATSLLMIIGGFLFGAIPGFFYSLVGSFLGGTGAYCITRTLFGNELNQRYHHQLSQFRNNLEQRYIPYLIIMRIIPIIPFCLANVLCGLALVPLRIFWWTLVAGITPSLFIYSVLGTELGAARCLHDLITPKVTILLLLIALLTIIPLLRKGPLYGKSNAVI